MIFLYGAKELQYLKSKDKKLAKVIDELGIIEREVDTDLFSSVVHHIVGQQISAKAQASVWAKLQDFLGTVSAESVAGADITKLQTCGLSNRKAQYISEFALKVVNKEFNIERIGELSDEDAIKELTTLKGIGVWTAQMILLFCLQRPNILSYDDLAIIRGLRMVYHHRNITPQLFEKYRKRYSPYCSIASLYLWEISGGKVAGMKDYLPKQSKTRAKPKAAENNS